MAAFNFPNSPTSGDTHTENGVTFEYNGTVWKRQAAAGAQGSTGAQGDPGATGNQGNQGATGNQGNQGATGNQGNQGATGNQGNQGAAGNQGDPGSGGLQGAQGNQGATGNQGNQGAPGTGAQGDPGAQGNQGAPGNQGNQGTPGSQGNQGATGNQGNQGATGNQGNQGASGSGVAAGSDTQVQFNSSGSFAGSSNLTFDGTDLTCGGAVISNSDLKLKTNVKPIINALEKVLNLRGVEFDFIENGKHSIGFIAQEVEEIVPDLVTNSDPKGVAYQNFVALLVEAIKEQNDVINNLKERLENLENNR